MLNNDQGEDMNIREPMRTQTSKVNSWEVLSLFSPTNGCEWLSETPFKLAFMNKHLSLVPRLNETQEGVLKVIWEEGRTEN